MRALREESGLTIEAVAQAAEMTPEEIRSVEEGTAMPTAAQIDDLATAFGITVYRFVTKSIPQTRNGKLVAPETKLFHYGHGRNEAEAQAAKMRSKLDEIPFFDIDVPEDITMEEVDALTNECMLMIGNPVVLLNSVLRGISNDAIPQRMVERIRMNLHDVMLARDAIYFALEVKDGTVQLVLGEDRS